MMLAVSGSTAFLTALSILVTGVAISLVVLLAIQKSRLRSLRAKVMKADVWDDIRQLLDERDLKLDEQVERLREYKSLLALSPLASPERPIRDQEFRSAAAPIRPIIRSRLERYEATALGLRTLTVEGLDDWHQLLLVAFYTEWKRLNDLEMVTRLPDPQSRGRGDTAVQ
jgi:hypothetical protein